MPLEQGLIFFVQMLCVCVGENERKLPFVLSQFSFFIRRLPYIYFRKKRERKKAFGCYNRKLLLRTTGVVVVVVVVFGQSIYGLATPLSPSASLWWPRINGKRKKKKKITTARSKVKIIDRRVGVKCQEKFQMPADDAIQVIGGGRSL